MVPNAVVPPGRVQRFSRERGGVRVELYFRTVAEVCTLVNDVLRPGLAQLTGLNLVHKEPGDLVLNPLACAALRQGREAEQLPMNVAVHYSVKNSSVFKGRPPRVRDQGVDQSVAVMRCLEKYAHTCAVEKLLLVSGTNWRMPSLRATELLPSLPAPLRASCGAAFNPYSHLLPESASGYVSETQESESLARKLEHVQSVWLQFGTDVEALRRGLESLRTLVLQVQRPESCGSIEIYGSLFVPTPSWRAKMRFRCWAGVLLSPDYLSDQARAEQITQDILDVYYDFGVVPLIESPIRTQRDCLAASNCLAGLPTTTPSHQERDAGGKRKRRDSR
ncbi:hypothetical protein FVE85_7207 [Porphyridium purpureum]|uniref:Uncharacterized protein n=1 Tax=Porphyridium purpureum TaxID=35688 RepID=A0A5J4Z976_PORPP|nr:hypothetical protein FVE85_7207 [Porphyridium purpureum]|eukprot:POR7279..scf295_1